MPDSGVYCITNTVNGHRYIGSAVNINKRWREHTRDLNKNCHHSDYLQRAWDKYGADCFEFSVLECCEKERLLEREQVYIDNERHEYNMAKFAGAPMRGMKLSEEHKHKIGEPQKGELNHFFGRQHTEESNRKNSEAHKGNTNTLGHRNHLGHKHTDETRRKMSEAQQRRRQAEANACQP